MRKQKEPLEEFTFIQINFKKQLMRSEKAFKLITIKLILGSL